jgi:hypothetical protein
MQISVGYPIDSKKNQTYGSQEALSRVIAAKTQFLTRVGLKQILRILKG